LLISFLKCWYISHTIKFTLLKYTLPHFYCSLICWNSENQIINLLAPCHK
jgi:hypothetical protein